MSTIKKTVMNHGTENMIVQYYFGPDEFGKGEYYYRDFGSLLIYNGEVNSAEFASIPQIARRWGVSYATARRWCIRYRDELHTTAAEVITPSKVNIVRVVRWTTRRPSRGWRGNPNFTNKKYQKELITRRWSREKNKNAL